jgi:RNA polymerase sigma-70 factor (family 1)
MFSMFKPSIVNYVVNKYKPKTYFFVQTIDRQALIENQLGDEASFERMFRTHYARLCAFAATIIDDRDEAEEVVQTMFCRLWEQRNALDITISVQAYLFRSVRNACLNHLKKMKIRDTYKATNLENLNQNPEYQPDRTTHSELSKKLEKAIAELPEQCRLVFKLSRFEELKYREIAEQLGISIKTVENQMGKALKVLRFKLADFLTLIFLILNAM